MANSNATPAPATAPAVAPAVQVQPRVTRTRINQQSGTNIVTVSVSGTGKGPHTVLCLGQQPRASMASNYASIAALAKTPGATGHNTTGHTYPTAAIAKPNVYTPAAWCAGCAAIVAASQQAAQARAAATALPAPQASK